MDTATLPAISAPRFNAAQRYLETRVETSVPGIYLVMMTSHESKSYRSYLDRVQIEGGVLTMKIDRARFSDIAPIAPRTVDAPRYSAKTMESVHADFVPLVEARLAEALSWAERF